VCEPLHEEIVVKLVGEVGNWKIVAHIAFKFYSVASGTFSTGSTVPSARCKFRRRRSRLRQRPAAAHSQTHRSSRSRTDPRGPLNRGIGGAGSAVLVPVDRQRADFMEPQRGHVELFDLQGIARRAEGVRGGCPLQARRKATGGRRE